MKIVATSLVIIFTITFLIGCNYSQEYDRGFSSSDKEYMQRMESLMKKRLIPYKVDEGKIWYSSNNEKDIKNIQTQWSSRTSVKYDEKETREYLIKLLESNNADYFVNSRSDGVWITWFPLNDEQKKNISMKVVRYAISEKAISIISDCANKKTKTPPINSQNYHIEESRNC